MTHLSIVSIVAVNKNVQKSVREAVELIGGIKSFVEPCDSVLIKPNLITALESNRGFTTDLCIIKALLELCWEAKACKVIIAEGSGAADTKYAFKVCGYEFVANEVCAEFVDVNTSKAKDISIPDGKALKSIRVSEVVLKSDVIINVPKFKVRKKWATLSIKNVLGLVPGRGRNYDREGRLQPFWTPEADPTFRFFQRRGRKRRFIEQVLIRQS